MQDIRMAKFETFYFPVYSEEKTKQTFVQANCLLV